MNIPFIKMHGLGNDYVYIDCFRPETSALIERTDIPSLARAVSDRHRGVGSDGLVLIMPSSNADVRMRMFNADGSEAEMCGNAARCVAKYAFEQGLCGQTMTLETLAGIKNITIQAQENRVKSVTVEIGVTTGNPHEVFFVDKSNDLNPSFEHLRSATQYADLRARKNVECAFVDNRHEITMRVCERGTGETQACGTGACATAVAAMDKGLTENEVTVHMPGGDVTVYRDEKGIIYLTGTATTVFAGTYFIDEK